MGPLRDDFFYSHTGDVHIGKMDTHIGIAFVGAHDKFPRLRNSKVDPSDGHLGGKEFLPQVNSCGLREVGRIFIAFFGMELLMEKFGNLSFFQVNRR